MPRIHRAFCPSVVAGLLTVSAAVFAQAPAVPPPADATPVTPGQPAQAMPAATDTFTMHYKFVPGAIWNYAMATDMDGAMNINGQSVPLKEHMTMTLTEAVQSVRPGDGAATVQITAENIALTMNGSPISLPQQMADSLKQAYTIVLSPTGHILSVKGSIGGAGMPSTDTMQQTSQMSVLPDHPVKVGDSWKANSTVGESGLQFLSKMTLTGVAAAADGSSIAHIATKFTAQSTAAGSQLGAMKMDGTGESDFNITTGLLQHAETATSMSTQTSDGAAEAGANMRLTVGMHMDLISATTPTGTTAPATALAPAQATLAQ